MNIATICSRACLGIDAPLVRVEVHISRGLPKLTIVGLASSAVKESKDRVRSAMINTGFEFPLQRITVNLSPADLPKQGGRFDLPIALGILIASKQIQARLECYEIVGELALSGELQKIPNMLPVLMAAGTAGRSVIIPKDNAIQACWVEANNIYAADTLLSVIKHLTGKTLLPICSQKEITSETNISHDMAEVQGQETAKRILEISAAGAHHLLMVGAPGVGKSMLASRLPSILPSLNTTQAQTVAALHMQHAQGFNNDQWRIPPFRSPHHTTSTVAMMGGGQIASPGEVSLAHHGVLFLDEWPEFSRTSKEALREPLSTGVIHIARAQYRISYPAQFQLIAAMNPCPCGHWQDGTSRCRCTHEQIKKYQSRISGPLLDRIDLKLHMHAPPSSLLLHPSPQEHSQCIAKRVSHARKIQYARQHALNAHLGSKELLEQKVLSKNLLLKLERWTEQNHTSLRSINKIIKVSRTIADLEQIDKVAASHLEEALSYQVIT